ncbi:MAG: S9 family peptidase [Gemmatimonadetes bacterium]|nr:S9 family peptidase [Gemmatimonadota bacterium]
MNPSTVSVVRNFLLFIPTCFIVSAQFAVAQQSTLGIDDQFAIQAVANPKLSPDEQWVAYTVRTTSIELEKSETRLWMISTSGGVPIPMTSKGYSVSNVEWGPEGGHLSFIASKNSGESQVWQLDLRGGEAQQITSVEQGVQSYEWSPDGSKLLLTLQDPQEEKDEEKTAEPWVITRLQIKRDGRGYLTDTRHSHLYVFDIETQALKQITSGRWDESQPSWSPDGRLVAFVSNRTEDPDANSNSDIWIVSVDNTDKGQTLLQLTTYPGSDSSPSWSPDGKWITYVTDDTDPQFSSLSVNQLAMVSSAGGPRKLVHPDLDRNVRNPQFDSEGENILVSIEDSGERYLGKIQVQGSNLERISKEGYTMSSFSAAASGATSLVLSSPHLPSEVFLIDDDDHKQLTHTNENFIQTLNLAEVTNIHFPSKDGTSIEGWIFTPPGYDSSLRYPTILRIHGGPNGMYGVNFNFEAQLLAANGYVVLLTNPRGSSGYGQDFSMALWQKWGIPDFDDVMAGIDYVLDAGYADPNRLGVGGWSYGGILTNYVITKSERFSAAITGASMGLLVANFGHDHYQLGNEREWGLPWETREIWENLSPFNSIEKVTTPTLVMGGEKDWNVPIQNSEQIYQALRRMGVPTQLIVYPGQPHGLRIPSYQKDRLERYLAWYDKWLKGTETVEKQ